MERRRQCSYSKLWDVLTNTGTLRVGGGHKLWKIDIIQLLMDHRMQW